MRELVLKCVTSRWSADTICVASLRLTCWLPCHLIRWDRSYLVATTQRSRSSALLSSSECWDWVKSSPTYARLRNSRPSSSWTSLSSSLSSTCTASAASGGWLCRKRSSGFLQWILTMTTGTLSTARLYITNISSRCILLYCSLPEMTADLVVPYK